jgi:hypothetical protein
MIILNVNGQTPTWVLVAIYEFEFVPLFMPAVIQFVRSPLCP